MKLFLFLVLALSPMLANAVEAEVYKCKSAGGKILYQSEPCSPKTNQKVIAVEAQTPEQREEAEAKLREWRDQQAIQDAENAAKAEKERELAQEQAEQQKRMQQQRAVETPQPSGINRRFGYLPYPTQR